MKAIRYYGKEDVRLEDIPEPELQPGTVKISLAYNGICGSDLHLYFEESCHRLPRPMNRTPFPGKPFRWFSVTNFPVWSMKSARV